MLNRSCSNNTPLIHAVTLGSFWGNTHSLDADAAEKQTEMTWTGTSSKAPWRTDKHKHVSRDTARPVHTVSDTVTSSLTISDHSIQVLANGSSRTR